jgi:predicted nucleic acid-binding protein
MPPRPHRPAAKKKAPGTQAFVLDASVALAWFFEDEADAYAEAVEEALARVTPVVPALWVLEVTNALLVGERRKRTTEAKTTQFAGLLRALPIAVDEQAGAHAFGDLLPLARTHGLSAYDAVYLELALRRGLPLATLDRTLLAAAKTVGVAAFAP